MEDFNMPNRPLYKTKNPRAFAQFFSEVDHQNLIEAQKKYEKFHGSCGESEEIVFFRKIPGEKKCPRELKEDTNFSTIEDFQFCSEARSKDFRQCQLLVTVTL